jgi:hypothetical protein
MYSYDYIQGTSTTYEGGSYQGTMGGIELPSTASGERNLGGKLRALYIDPVGNAGYLEGILTGKAYPGTKMFEMDGALTRTQAETAAEMGVTAASDLTYNWGSLNNVNFNGIFKDETTTVGAINGYFNTGSTETIFNTKSNVSTDWGLYGFVLYGAYDTAAANWEAKMGGQGSFGAYKRPGDAYISNSAGYWLADIDGAWTSDRLTSTVGGRFLSQTLLGEMDGTLGGTYDPTAKTWEASSGGKWSGTPLSFVSNFYGSRYKNLINGYDTGYNYSGGGSYRYNYVGDNSWGQTEYQPTSGYYPRTVITYNSNGTTRTDTYDAAGKVTTTNGAWNPQAAYLGDLLLAARPMPTGQTATVGYQNTYQNFQSIGNLNGNMGGTESLWYGADGIPVTLMGRYYNDAGNNNTGNNLWSTYSFNSYNYKTGKPTTYDGGAYLGFIGGTEVPSSASGDARDLEGRVMALYIDPAGNAGYLKGDLTGRAYPGISMFEMDGALFRSQVVEAAKLGVSPADLSAAPIGWIGAPNVEGVFVDGSTKVGDMSGASGNSNTLYIFNKATNVTTDWGIYALNLRGTYETTALTYWEAMMGGSGTFGAYKTSANFSVADNGYWLADINGGWADGKITGAVEGRYISNTKLGEITGDFIGAYGGVDWRAVSLGTLSGTPLTYMSNLDTTGNRGVQAYRGAWIYSGGGSYTYTYDVDSQYGTQTVRSTSGTNPRTSTLYYGDGTTLITVYDAAGQVTSTTSGAWNPTATDLKTFLAAPPVTGETATLTTPEYAFTRRRSTDSFTGIMGGTQSLWYEADGTTIHTTKENIPVTLMGTTGGGYKVGGDSADTSSYVWYTSNLLSSYNYKDGTFTAYEGGSYQGLMGSVFTPTSLPSGKKSFILDGRFMGVYVDPVGNAGYLQGDLAGELYRGKSMFDMDGVLTRSQVMTAAEMGIAPADVGFGGRSLGIHTVTGVFKDETTAVGDMTGTTYNGNTIGIINKTTGVDAGFGVYGMAFSGSYNTATTIWEANIGDKGAPGPGGNSYFLGGITGDWADGKITGSLAGRSLGFDALSEISGDLFGTYNTVTPGDNTWQAVSLGTWKNTPLKYASSFNSSRYDGLIKQYYGNYTYSGGGSYDYSYQNDNIYGSQVYPLGWTTYRSTLSSYPFTSVSYMSDGTTSSSTCTSANACSNTSIGTWNKTIDLAALATLFSTTLLPLPPATETGSWQYQNSYDIFHGIGTLNGNMGGTQSLWGADGATIPVTLMGTYYQDIGHAGAVNNIWYSGYVNSYNYKNGTSTTYDGGSYQGIMGGIERPSSAGATRDLIGNVAALYIDPAGNAGYLRGGLAGKAYPGVAMFEMDGTLSRTQVATAAEVGVSAADLTNNTNPNTYWAWINADYGVRGTFSDGTTDYGTITASSYPANNTLSIYNKTSKLFQGWGIYGLGFSGVYDTAKPDWKARMGGRGAFGVGEIINDYIVSDDGYWSADVNGSWADGKLLGAVTGNFMTNRKLGDISGDLFGVYNTAAGTWQGVSLGTWTGTALSHVSNVSAGLTAATRDHSGRFFYFDGSYVYHYYADNHSGFLNYDRTGTGENYNITYHADGTYTKYDIISGASTTGNWRMEGHDSLAFLENPPDPAFIGTLPETINFVSYPDGSLQGLMGGTASLWTATASSPAPVTMMGSFAPSGNVSPLWTTEVYSKNYNDLSNTTYNGGAYRGFLGGTEIGGAMDGGLIGLYVDPSGNAGYLKGALTGTAYRDMGMFKMEGGLYPIQIASALGVAPTTFYAGIGVQDFGLLATAEFSVDSIASLMETKSERWINTDPSWGVWQSILGGEGAGTGPWTPPSSWTWATTASTNATYWTSVAWTAGASKVTGDAAGAKVDWVNASTYVYGGDLRGLFDPAAATWKAVAQGAWMETGKFLAMANGATTTETASAALKALNIPAVQVGKATLSQVNPTTEVNGLTNVNMANVTFLANSTGGTPRIWATNGVAGNYNQAIPPVAGGTAATLSGGGLTANFGIQNWNSTTGKWGANITNGTGNLSGGTYNGAVDFKGGAAGTFVGGNLTGTAAGIVK